MPAKPKIRSFRVQSVEPLATQLEKRVDVMEKLIKELKSGAVGTQAPGGLGSPLDKARRLRVKLKLAAKVVKSCCSDNTLGATFKIRK